MRPHSTKTARCIRWRSWCAVRSGCIPKTRPRLCLPRSSTRRPSLPRPRQKWCRCWSRCSRSGLAVSGTDLDAAEAEGADDRGRPRHPPGGRHARPCAPRRRGSPLGRLVLAGVVCPSCRSGGVNQRLRTLYRAAGVPPTVASALAREPANAQPAATPSRRSDAGAPDGRQASTGRDLTADPGQGRRSPAIRRGADEDSH
jgi:hypothetical protein